MRLQKLFFLVLCANVYAASNVGYPVSPELMFPILNENKHSMDATSLADLNEAYVSGALGVDLQQSLAVSTPYFQLITARQNYKETEAAKASTNNIDTTVTREYFRIATGVKLSDWLALEQNDFYLGLAYDFQKDLFDSNSVQTSDQKNLIVSSALKLNQWRIKAEIPLSLNYFNSGLNYVLKNNYEAGAGLVGNFKDKNCQVSFAFQKNVLDVIRLKSEIDFGFNRDSNNNIVNNKQIITLGTGFRLRTANSSDPQILAQILPDPNTLMGRIMTDMEFNILVNFNLNTHQAEPMFSLGRWF